jgi:hypothetical protein
MQCFLMLSNYDWSSLYIGTYVNAAVDRLNFTVIQAVGLAVHCGQIKKHKQIKNLY